jgi:hypothetical protein
VSFSSGLIAVKRDWESLRQLGLCCARGEYGVDFHFQNQLCR